MMHSKSLVVDGLWGAVGTMNFDNRSLVFNDETMLLVLDPGYGARLERIFERDLEVSVEMDLERWRRRPAAERLRERGASMFSRLL
jgi:cardiolipin synthase